MERIIDSIGNFKNSKTFQKSVENFNYKLNETCDDSVDVNFDVLTESSVSKVFVNVSKLSEDYAFCKVHSDLFEYQTRVPYGILSKFMSGLVNDCLYDCPCEYDNSPTSILNESSNGLDLLDISDLKVTQPKNVVNIELSEKRLVYKLTYSFNNKKFIKYFADSRNLQRATNFAESDYKIHKWGLKPSECVDLLQNTQDEGVDVPEKFLIEVGATMWEHYPKGFCENYSKHYYEVSYEDKVGHGIMPSTLFNTWARRAIAHVPNGCVYVCEDTEAGCIRIPVRIAYKNHCRELDDIASEALKSVINIVPPKKREYIKASPILARVYAYPDRKVVTEYFGYMADKNLEKLEDFKDNERIKPIPTSAISEGLFNEIKSVCRWYLNNYLNYKGIKK